MSEELKQVVLLAGVEQTASVLRDAQCAGNLRASWQGVTTDSRQVAPGNLFVALRGERFDAHDFLDQVQLAGATVLLVEKMPSGMQLLPQVATIMVPDTRQALQQLASYWRQQFTMPLIAVTGSNGKTTVKEMIAAILRAAYGENAMLATRGNLNNDIGVPLSALRLSNYQKAAVLELGMNHPGEIAVLAAIAQATVALVNNAQREHQEFMHSVRAVAEENGSVLKQLPADGVAVFPYDDEFTALWQEYAGARRVLHFGLHEKADVSGSYHSTEFGNTVQVRLRQEGATRQFSLQLAAAGEHNVKNALAAIACCYAAGIEINAIVQGLESFAPVAGRLQRKQSPHGALVIDDSYNANPDSVRAAIEVLAKTERVQILVLGDMGEVGNEGPAFHAEIGSYAAQANIDHLFCLGTASAACVAAWQQRVQISGTQQTAQHFSELADLLAALDELPSVQQGKASILVKGSRSMQMERIVQHLLGQTITQGAH